MGSLASTIACIFFVTVGERVSSAVDLIPPFGLTEVFPEVLPELLSPGLR